LGVFRHKKCLKWLSIWSWSTTKNSYSRGGCKNKNFTRWLKLKIPGF
jgi:hypothetical protein